MNRIVEIRPRRKKLSLIVREDGETALLDTTVLQENGVRAGQELPDERLEELSTLSQQHRAREKVLYLLEYRSHSKKELADKISRVTTREAAQEAADRMEELGLIDDETYAADCARELVFRKGFSYSRARFELQRKGIDRETAEYALDELHADWDDILRTLIQRRYSHCLQNEKDRRRAVNALLRLGYRYDEIRPLLREFGPVEEE